MLPPLGAQASRNRLGLAQWLVNGKHPLTARVMINRIWQEHFGHGLFTPEDFAPGGIAYPQLLIGWRKNGSSGWDMKHIHRLIVTQPLTAGQWLTAETLKHDPDNRWLSRGPRYRMAEMIRDSALWIGGLLVETEGEEGSSPTSRQGLEGGCLSSSSTANFVRDDGDPIEGALYVFQAHQSSTSMTCWMPQQACMVKRERTNTPLQALHLMNDVQYVEAARGFAEWITTVEQALSSIKSKSHDPRGSTKARPNRNSVAGHQWQDHHKHFQAHPEEATA